MLFALLAVALLAVLASALRPLSSSRGASLLGVRRTSRLAAEKAGDKPWVKRDDKKLVKDWRSGNDVFKGGEKQQQQQPGRSRRNDPWWMREDEKTNPRVLPVYKPWWLEKVPVDDSWKVADLRKEAERRGMESAAGMKKAEILSALQSSTAAYDLSDSGFRAPTFRAHTPGELPSCWPDVYEGGKAEIEKLQASIMGKK
jgi:hypothetical protein